MDTDHDHLAKLSIIHFASLRSLCKDKCVTPCGVILPATDLQGQNAKVASVGTVILQIRLECRFPIKSNVVRVRTQETSGCPC